MPLPVHFYDYKRNREKTRLEQTDPRNVDVELLQAKPKATLKLIDTKLNAISIKPGGTVSQLVRGGVSVLDSKQMRRLNTTSADFVM